MKISHLLNFKLTLARPVDRAITKPRANKVDERLDFAGDAGRIEHAFKIAIKSQLTT